MVVQKNPDDIDRDLTTMSNRIEVEKVHVGFLAERLQILKDFFKSLPFSNGNGNGSNHVH